MSSPEVQSLDSAQAECDKCETATNQVLSQLNDTIGTITDSNLQQQLIELLLQLHLAVMEERGATLRASNAKSDLTATNAAMAVKHLQESFLHLEEMQSGSDQKKSGR
jgi:hypothetical protein